MRNQHEAQLEKEEKACSWRKWIRYYRRSSWWYSLAEIFKAQGVDYIISGGQTMNPSTEDFIKAVDQVNARNIIFLPVKISYKRQLNLQHLKCLSNQR